ncbi:MAG: DeoR family transcriptional regulator [Patescibacteria group bacterium]|nr:DeoR family transcriptional regulator [Patescibacteria group bacterium]
MDKRYFVDLTSKLYRLTFFFPQKEPLRDRIRETSDEILADVVVILEGEIEEKKQAAFRVEKNIKILDVLLDLAKLQNWIEEEKVEIVKNNYLAIKREVEELNDITRRNMKMLEPENFLSESNLKQSEPDTPRNFDTPRHSERSEEPQQKSPVTQEKPIPKPKKTRKKRKTGLNARQKKIVEIMREREKIQIQNIEPNFPNVTKRTLRRDISYLVDKKIVKREGKANLIFYKA